MRSANSDSAIKNSAFGKISFCGCSHWNILQAQILSLRTVALFPTERKVAFTLEIGLIYFKQRSV